MQWRSMHRAAYRPGRNSQRAKHPSSGSSVYHRTASRYVRWLVSINKPGSATPVGRPWAAGTGPDLTGSNGSGTVHRGAEDRQLAAANPHRFPDDQPDDGLTDLVAAAVGI